MRFIQIAVFLFCLTFFLGLMPFVVPDSMPARAQIVDVSGIDVPPANGPECVSGCEDDEPEPDPEPEPEPDPTPAPKPQPAPQPAPQPVPQPALQPTPQPQPIPQPPPPPAPDPRQVAFEQEKRALLNDFQLPSSSAVDYDTAPVLDIDSVVPLTIGTGSVPINLKQGGLTQEEWDTARECQRKIDLLTAKWPTNSQETAQLDQLISKRNALWKKAVGIPGLTAEERERLRIKLYTRDVHATDGMLPTVTSEQIKTWSKPPPPLPDPKRKPDEPAPDQVNPVALRLIADFTAERLTEEIEDAAEDLAESELGEIGGKFGDFLEIGKIAVAYKEGGAPSALSETFDILIGKIPIPQASLAVEGGRLYANVVYEAQNRFMTDAMKAAGGEFDREGFWSDFDNSLTVWQKAVKEWVSYGED